MRVINIITAAGIILALLFVTNVSAAWSPYRGMWLNRSELDSLPMTGSAWNHVVSVANSSWGSANLSDQDSKHDTNTLAGALYAARTGNEAMRTKTANAIMSIIETENGGRVLGVARNLPAYVISADLINLQAYNATMGNTFTTWLSAIRREKMSQCDDIIACHERRPNNWGTHAGSARIAMDIYLNDTVDLDRAAKVFKGWLGDRSAYAGFDYGDLSWQCSNTAPVGINRNDCGDKSSIIPDDMRRGGSYKLPPGKTNYTWAALEGVAIQAELLARRGYPSWSWGYSNLNDQAIRRSVAKLDDLQNKYGGEWWATGDDVSTVWIIERAYKAGFKTTVSKAGKSIDFTDWTHNRDTVAAPTQTKTPVKTPTVTPTLTPTPVTC